MWRRVLVNPKIPSPSFRPALLLLQTELCGGLIRVPLFVLSCFVLAHKENELAHQSGTGPRGSRSWEGSFTSARHRTEEKVGMPHLPSPFSSLSCYTNKAKEAWVERVGAQPALG